MGFDTQRERDALDNHITGHYGEDQFPADDPIMAVVYWNDGMVNEWTMAVTGERDVVLTGLNNLTARGKDQNDFWMQHLVVASQLPLTIDPTEPIEDFLARDWSVPECQCGHHIHGTSCAGTVGSMSDGDMVMVATKSWGWSADEPCVCVEYMPVEDEKQWFDGEEHEPALT